MNTQRKLHVLFFIITGFTCVHINAMQQLDNRNTLIYFATGCVVGVGCIGIYNWHTQNILKTGLKNLKKNMQHSDEIIQTLKSMQDSETNRLNQTREWVLQQNKKSPDARLDRVEMRLFDLETRVYNFQDCELSE